MLFDLGLIAKIADRVWILNWSRCPRNVGLSTRCRRRKAKRFLHRSIAASSYRSSFSWSASLSGFHQPGTDATHEPRELGPERGDVWKDLER